jgi:hypothetical protein
MTSRIVDIELYLESINIKRCGLQQSDSPCFEYRHQISPSVQLTDQFRGLRVNTYRLASVFLSPTMKMESEISSKFDTY